MADGIINKVQFIVREEDSKKCDRCGGWMAREEFKHDTGIFFGWNCILCGEMIDPVILLNRTKQNSGIRPLRKGKFS